jgi:hypothetical protein
MQATQEKLKRAKDRRLSLLEEISVDGHCAYRDPDTGISSCTIPAKSCDIDHMDPNTILADGRRRKQACFSQLWSVAEIETEISRNTADGRLLLQALCPQHHPKTWFQVAPKRAKGGEVHERWKAVARMKIDIGKCQYEECDIPHFLCQTEEDVPSFHFDHLFCAGDNTAPAMMKKRERISKMVILPKVYSLDDIEDEISKCRLVHATCHRKISARQIAQGLCPKFLRHASRASQ